MKIGLYFGSFNPIHIGHLAIANYIVEYTDLDKVWFVVSPHNPLKNKAGLLAQHHRLELVRLAIENDWRFDVSDIEFHLPQPSYTAHTLAHLNEKYPDKEFSLIMGADNLASLEKWKNYNHLLEHYSIYVYPRPETTTNADRFENHKITVLDCPTFEVSSSFIRNAIKDKKDIRHFVPERSWVYLDQMNFYK